MHKLHPYFCGHTFQEMLAFSWFRNHLLTYYVEHEISPSELLFYPELLNHHLFTYTLLRGCIPSWGDRGSEPSAIFSICKKLKPFAFFETHKRQMLGVGRTGSTGCLSIGKYYWYGLQRKTRVSKESYTKLPSSQNVDEVLERLPYIYEVSSDEVPFLLSLLEEKRFLKKGDLYTKEREKILILACRFGDEDCLLGLQSTIEILVKKGEELGLHLLSEYALRRIANHSLWLHKQMDVCIRKFGCLTECVTFIAILATKPALSYLQKCADEGVLQARFALLTRHPDTCKDAAWREEYPASMTEVHWFFIHEYGNQITSSYYVLAKYAAIASKHLLREVHTQNKEECEKKWKQNYPFPYLAYAHDFGRSLIPQVKKQIREADSPVWENLRETILYFNYCLPEFDQEKQVDFEGDLIAGIDSALMLEKSIADAVLLLGLFYPNEKALHFFESLLEYYHDEELDELPVVFSEWVRLSPTSVEFEKRVKHYINTSSSADFRETAAQILNNREKFLLD